MRLRQLPDIGRADLGWMNEDAVLAARNLFGGFDLRARERLYVTDHLGQVIIAVSPPGVGSPARSGRRTNRLRQQDQPLVFWIFEILVAAWAIFRRAQLVVDENEVAAGAHVQGVTVTGLDVDKRIENPGHARLDRCRKSAERLIEASGGKAPVLRTARGAYIGARLAGGALGIPARLEVAGPARGKLYADSIDLLELPCLTLHRSAWRAEEGPDDDSLLLPGRDNVVPRFRGCGLTLRRQFHCCHRRA